MIDFLQALTSRRSIFEEDLTQANNFMTETFFGPGERKATDLCSDPVTFCPSPANSVEDQDQSITASTAIKLLLRSDSGHVQTDNEFKKVNLPFEDDGYAPSECMDWFGRNSVPGSPSAGEGLVSDGVVMPYCKPISENGDATFDPIDNTFVDM